MTLFFMFDYNQVFESIHNHKTHLKPSTVCDGVGLFALRDIEKDELLFKFVTNDIKIAAKDVQSTVDPIVEKYIISMCYYDKNDESYTLDVPLFMIYTEYYINHSDDPNIFWDRNTHEMYAMKDIKSGEELTTYYRPDERDW